jgi:hypothetical protein
LLLQADEAALLADDDMIQDGNAQEPTDMQDPNCLTLMK